MRKRLQKLSRPATSRRSQDKFDYASELYTECVRGDPGNLEYLQSFMTNLHKKYGSAKKLGPMVQFKERGARAALKKAIAQCDWDEAIQQGITVLLVESLGRSHADRDGHGLRRHHEPGGRFRRRDLWRLRTVLPEVRLRHVSQRQARC